MPFPVLTLLPGPRARCLAILPLLSLTLCSAPLPAEDWPRWRGSRGDGTWQGPQMPEAWPAEGLPVVWRQAVGGGYSGVIVAEGRVFVMERQPLEAEKAASPEESTPPAEGAPSPGSGPPDGIERVLAFDAATGQPLWSHEYPVCYGSLAYGSGPRAAATFHDGCVYTLGAVGHVSCLDAATGTLLWSHDSVREFEAQVPEWGFAASPLVWSDLAIVHVAAQPDGCFLALDRVTGREVWRSSGDPAGYSTPIVIDRQGGEQLVGWTPEHVLGIAPRTGHVEWSVPYKVTYGVSIATPICRQELVFVTGYWEGSKAIRLGQRRAEVSLAWEDDDQLRGLMSQPLYRDGYVYSLDKRFGLTCFELETGRKLWDDEHRLTPRGRNPQVTLVWLGDDDRAIALNSEGELVLVRLTPAGYQEQSRTRIIGPTWAHPAYAGQCVYARDDLELVCVRISGEG